jgi:3-hydroxy-9,10-secoandrosta-1,3,5(10)-triene-9,17-dione monooxygenase
MVVATPEVADDEMVARAETLRPWLQEEQAATEQRTYYSAETHQRFKDAGFYRLLIPRRYGGLEMSVSTYWRVIAAIARGCPSTGWMLSLGAAHAMQLASYYGERAQTETFGDGEFIASASLAYQDALATPVDGGYEVHGTWHFCSGVPYATHHMSLVPTVSENITMSDLLLVILQRDQYRRLDNWGDLIGLKGSGSHSVVAEKTFVPAHLVIPLAEIEQGDGVSAGYELHGNPMYAGRFMAFAGGVLAAVQVGNAQATVDELERLLPGKREISLTMSGLLKTDSLDYQRCLGLGMAYTDSAHTILVAMGENYERLGRRRVEQRIPISDEDELRAYGQLMTATKLCWEAGETAFRAGSTSGARDGARMQRLFRDLLAFRTNGVHQFDFRAASLAQARLGLPITRMM